MRFGARPMVDRRDAPHDTSIYAAKSAVGTRRGDLVTQRLPRVVGSERVPATVIIPMRNAEATVRTQLDALAAQTVRGFEVIIADDGSEDCSWEVAASSGLENLRLLRVGPSIGAAAARNFAATQARGDVLLFCDADDEVSEAWVEKLQIALERFDIVAGRMEGERLNPKTEGWRRLGGVETARPLPYALSANMGVRRAAFDAVKGFPTDLRHAGEDTALSWSLQLAGFSFGYEPEAVVHYRFRPDLRSHIRQHYRYGRQNAVLRLRYQALKFPPPVAWWRTCGWLLLHLDLLLMKRSSGYWLGIAAHRVGYAVGSSRIRRRAGRIGLGSR